MNRCGIRVFCLTVSALLFAHQLLAQPSTKVTKVRSRDLLAIERKRAQEESAAHQSAIATKQGEIDNLRSQLEALEKKETATLKEQLQKESAKEREIALSTAMASHQRETQEIKSSLERQLAELNARLAKSEAEADKWRTQSELGLNRNWFGAIKSGTLTILEKMVKDRPDRVESVSSHPEVCPPGYTSLLCAVEYNQPALVAWLLSQGAGVEKTNSGTTGIFTPLLLAVFKGLPAIAQTLLEAGANVNAETTISTPIQTSHYLNVYTRVTPIVIAAKSGTPAMIDLLVMHKASLQDFAGQNLLSLAYQENRLDLVKRLLELGADPSNQFATGNLIAGANDPYLSRLWDATLKGTRRQFLAAREHEAFLAIKSGCDFPDPVTHIILSAAFGPITSIQPGDRADTIKHGLSLLGLK
jgi:Skp family chaperone for outer membrane proteins